MRGCANGDRGGCDFQDEERKGEMMIEKRVRVVGTGKKNDETRIMEMSWNYGWEESGVVEGIVGKNKRETKRG
jgi:hypothetical protein